MEGGTGIFLFAKKLACQACPFTRKKELFWGEQPPFVLFEHGGRYLFLGFVGGAAAARPFLKIICSADNRLTRRPRVVKSCASVAVVEAPGTLPIRSLNHFCTDTTWAWIFPSMFSVPKRCAIAFAAMTVASPKSEGSRASISFRSGVP